MRDKKNEKFGFTLLELLVTIAIIGILASVILAAAHRANEYARSSTCISNLRQLQQAWIVYGSDHGQLPPNHDGVEETNTWVRGWLAFEADWSDSTNTLYLTDPRHASLASYVSDPALYQCPSDDSRVKMGEETYQRVRSYSMNQAMGLSEEGAKERTEPYHLTVEVHVEEGRRHAVAYQHINDIHQPSRRWVLIEEHPDSINDGSFALGLPQEGSNRVFWDVPAPYHNDTTVLAFADGHVESHAWKNEDTTPSIKNEQNLLEVSTTRVSQDFHWLARRTTRVEKE